MNAMFIDPTERKKHAVNWLYAGTFCAIGEAGGWLLYLCVQLFVKMQPEAREIGEFFQGIVGLALALFTVASVVIVIVTTILILMLVHQINSNARVLGAQNMKFTPGWSVGWFLIPFANLFQVPKVMNELWKTSYSPKSWEQVPENQHVHLWWGLWIIANALVRVTDRYYKEDIIALEVLWPTVMYLVSSVLAVFAGFLLVSLIKKITSMQMSHAQSINRPEITS